MDIVIVIPPRIVDDFGYTPAGPALLKGSIVQAGFSCKIMDLNSELENHPDINTLNNYFLFHDFYGSKIYNTVSTIMEQNVQDILDHNPTWVGISVFSYNSHRATRLLCMFLKKSKPDLKIIIGGAGIQTDFTFAESLYEQKLIDVYVRGEGEVAIVNVLQSNLGEPGINGNTPEQITNVDEIPFPMYDDYSMASYVNKKGLVALPITGSRGCVRRCTFCDVQYNWPVFKYRSGENIADEIKHHIQEYGAKAFRFTDSLINGNMKEFKSFCTALSQIDDDFFWDSHFIIRSEKQMPPNDFKLLKQSHAGTLLIGVESGSEQVRDHMKKGYSNKDLYYTIGQLSENKIKCRLLMIVGYPTETEQDFEDTCNMFRNFVPYVKDGTIEEINLGLTLNLLPNTPLQDNLGEYNLVKMNNHINDWICTDNPTLTFKERLRRRITLQALTEELGYNIFNKDDYVRTLFMQWKQVNEFKNTTSST